jgi:hypothetical protein
MWHINKNHKGNEGMELLQCTSGHGVRNRVEQMHMRKRRPLGVCIRGSAIWHMVQLIESSSLLGDELVNSTFSAVKSSHLHAIEFPSLDAPSAFHDTFSIPYVLQHC